MPQPPFPLTIGQVAHAAGVNRQTVRYYQRRGLIEQPPRPVSGYRHYKVDTVARIRFIKRAQRLGFSLAEISALLELGNRHCEDARRVAERQRDAIDAHIHELSAMRQTLNALIARCEQGQQPAPCPLIESLFQPECTPPDKA